MTTPEKRADIAERYGWQPGEQEALEADMAERAARIKRDETLRWCRERNEAKTRKAETMATDYPCDATGNPLRGHDVTRSYDAPMSSNANTTQWERWVNAQIKKSARANDDVMIGALADIVAPIKQNAAKANDEIATLREEMTKLQIELAEVRGELRGRVAAEAERQARSPLRSVGHAVSA